jgi:hypothetical protein
MPPSARQPRSLLVLEYAQDEALAQPRILTEFRFGLRGGTDPGQAADALTATLAQRFDGRVYPHNASSTVLGLRLMVDRGVDPDRIALSSRIIAAAGQAGVRLRASGFLAWETGIALADPWDRRLRPIATLRAWQADPAWRNRAAALLDHDAVMGSLRYPDLVAELYLELAPESTYLALRAVCQGSREPFIMDHFLTVRGVVNRIDPAELSRFAQAAYEAEWLTNLVWAPEPQASAGPKARRLTAQDLL